MNAEAKSVFNPVAIILLLLVIAVGVFGLSRVNSLRAQVRSLETSLEEVKSKSQTNTLRIQDTERDFKLIRDKLN